MTISHSFFLPDPEYITDLEGLIEYLGAKVNIKWQFYQIFLDISLQRLLFESLYKSLKSFDDCELGSDRLRNSGHISVKHNISFLFLPHSALTVTTFPAGWSRSHVPLV